MSKLNKAMLLLLALPILLVVVVYPAFAGQSVLSNQELLTLLSKEIPGLDPVIRDVNYIDMDGDGILELLVGTNDRNSRKGHFFIYSYKGGRYVNKLHYEWTYAYWNIAFEQVRFDGKLSHVAIITYSPAFGTGWLPTKRDIIWWDGKGFRSIWSGLTDEVEAGTVDKEMLNSFLRFYYDEGAPVLEVVSVLRKLSDESIPGEVKTITIKNYKWDSKALSFVEKKK